MSSKTLKAEIL